MQNSFSPWHIHRKPDNGIQIKVSRGNNEDGVVCLVKAQQGRKEANARLIAAAPEMHDLLKRIVAEAIEHWPDAENWQVIQEAQALIERAA